MWNRTSDSDEATGKSRRTLLPVLVALFVISYGLLTMLVVEQARTIDSQRSLIGLLFDDSVQLASLRSKAIHKQNSDARAHAQADAQARAKSPSTEIPPQGSQVQTPSQATPSADARNHGSSKMRRQIPLRPPKGSSDEGDERRMSLTI